MFSKADWVAIFRDTLDDGDFTWMLKSINWWEMRTIQ